MVVLGANITSETLTLIKRILESDEFVKFKSQNKLNLSDNTILIRLALMNLFDNLPDNVKVQQHKVSLVRPYEFDEYLKEKLGFEVQHKP